MARPSISENMPPLLRSNRKSVPNFANLSRDFLSNSNDSIDRPVRRLSIRDRRGSQKDLTSMNMGEVPQAEYPEVKRKRFDGSLPHNFNISEHRAAAEDGSSPVSEIDNPLAGLHELDNTSFDAMNRSLEMIVQERQRGTSNNAQNDNLERKTSANRPWKNVFAMKNGGAASKDTANRPSSRRISMNGSDKPPATPKPLHHVASLNEGDMNRMQSRVATLEMEKLEVQALREKVKELEKALNVAKRDGSGTKIGLDTPPVPRRR